MNEMELLGSVIVSIITIGGFIAVIMKFIQPINDLRVVIQKLNDNIDSVMKDNANQDCRLNKHGEQIDSLGNRVGELEIKVELHHEKIKD